MKHSWVAVAQAPMSSEQAEVWLEADGAVDQPLAMIVSGVLCVICGQPLRETASTCAGRPEASGRQGSRDAPHEWVVLLTMPLDDEEAARYLADDELSPNIRPRSTNVVCILCGQTAEDADPSCAERAFWVRGQVTEDVPDAPPADWSEG